MGNQRGGPAGRCRAEHTRRFSTCDTLIIQCWNRGGSGGELTGAFLAGVGQVVVTRHVAPAPAVVPHHHGTVLARQEVAVRLAFVPVLIELREESKTEKFCCSRSQRANAWFNSPEGSRPTSGSLPRWFCHSARSTGTLCICLKRRGRRGVESFPVSICLYDTRGLSDSHLLTASPDKT